MLSSSPHFFWRIFFNTPLHSFIFKIELKMRPATGSKFTPKAHFRKWAGPSQAHRIWACRHGRLEYLWYLDMKTATPTWPTLKIFKSFPCSTNGEFNIFKSPKFGTTRFFFNFYSYYIHFPLYIITFWKNLLQNKSNSFNFVSIFKSIHGLPV